MMEEVNNGGEPQRYTNTQDTEVNNGGEPQRYTNTQDTDHTWKKYIPQRQTAQDGRDQKNEMIKISEP